jgi:glucoamylase
VWRRYGGRRPVARHALWWLHAPIASFAAGTALVAALDAPAILHWGHDGWREVQDVPTTDPGLGFHAAALATAALAPGTRVDFTWRSQVAGEWRGRDEAVEVSPAPMRESLNERCDAADTNS